MKKYKFFVLFLTACVIALIAGWWAMGLVRTSEFMHFSVNFPTEAGIEVLSLEELKTPWSRVTPEEREGYPAGGLVAWGREGEIVVDLGSQGIIKRLIQPDHIAISSHWIRNIGVKPYRIKLELDMCGFPYEWETFELAWDEETKTSTRHIEPQELFNMDWLIHVPPETRESALVCDGELRVIDADAGGLLTALPIRIINSEVE